MIAVNKPNAYFLRGALPTVEQSRSEYAATVYGAAALGYVASIKAADAIDALRERCPELVTGRARHACGVITGTKEHTGMLALLRLAINDQLADKAGRAWVADFGNAVYALVEDSLDALQTAIANALGRYQGVQERNVCAGIIVAQSLASEATAYVERRARMFTRFTLVAHDGVRRSVSSVLRTMSCKGISHNLEVVTRALLERRLPDGTDLLADPSVATGVKAVMNRLCDVDTWTAARDKADELNGIRNENNK